MTEVTSNTSPSHSEYLPAYIDIITKAALNAKKHIESDETLVAHNLIRERSPEEKKEGVTPTNGIRTMAAALATFKKIRSETETKYPESINQLIVNIIGIIGRPLGGNSEMTLIKFANPETYELFEKESKEQQALITKELTDTLDETVQLVISLKNEVPQLAEEQKQNPANNALNNILNGVLEGLNSLLNLIIKATKRIANGEPLYQKYDPVEINEPTTIRVHTSNSTQPDYQEQQGRELHTIPEEVEEKAQMNEHSQRPQL